MNEIDYISHNARVASNVQHFVTYYTVKAFTPYTQALLLS